MRWFSFKGFVHLCRMCWLVSSSIRKTFHHNDQHRLFLLVMLVIVGCWHGQMIIVCLNLCSLLQMELTREQQPRAQKKLILFFEIIRQRSPDPPWRGKTSSYASRQEVVKPESQFILPKNIWTTGGLRANQGKWLYWWTRYFNTSLVYLAYCMALHYYGNQIQIKHSIFQSVFTCRPAHHKLHTIRFRYSPALCYWMGLQGICSALEKIMTFFQL